MDRIVKVCQILAIIYYLLLITENECQTTETTETQNNGAPEIDKLISEIFDIPKDTQDRGGNGDAFPITEPTQPQPPTYPDTQPNVVQPETNYPKPETHYPQPETQTPPPPVVHPEPTDYKSPPPPQPSTPTGHPTGPYPNPSNLPASNENESNVSRNHVYDQRSTMLNE